MKIQLSEFCVSSMEKVQSRFETERRDYPIVISNKLAIKTFWLLGELHTVESNYDELIP